MFVYLFDFFYYNNKILKKIKKIFKKININLQEGKQYNSKNFLTGAWPDNFKTNAHNFNLNLIFNFFYFVQSNNAKKVQK